MPKQNGVLIVAETLGANLATVSFELLGAARKIEGAVSGGVQAALIGSGVAPLAEGLAEHGAEVVYVADDPALSPYQADAWLAALQAIVQQAQPGAIFLAHTPTGRELGPRLAFRLDTALVTDCIDVRQDGDRVVFVKPVFGGNATGDFTVATSPQMATIRPRSIEATEAVAGRPAEIVNVAVTLPESARRVKVVGVNQAAGAAGPKLSDARVIVSGGRGIGGPENWHYIEELADALGAAVGASRAVTDAGWVPPALQVGLTGVTVAPDLYIAVGISGAVQHIAGISGAKNVVAINQDPDANIYKYARYAVVGDFKQILPALTEKIKELRAR